MEQSHVGETMECYIAPTDNVIYTASEHHPNPNKCTHLVIMRELGNTTMLSLGKFINQLENFRASQFEANLGIAGTEHPKQRMLFVYSRVYKMIFLMSYVVFYLDFNLKN